MRTVPGLNIGIDLGTESIKFFAQKKGIILSEQTAICYDNYSGKAVAIGNAAGEMLDRLPDSLTLKRPVEGGVVSDFTAMTEILSHFIKKVCKNRIFRPNLIISAPCCVTSLEKKTVIEAACTAGAGRVHITDEPIVSALGAGLSIEHPHGTMVIDIGAGTTDIAVITMGTVACSSSIKTAGNSFDEALGNYLKRDKDIVAGIPTIKKIKHSLGSAYKREEEIEALFSGKDYITSLPRPFLIKANDTVKIFKEPIDIIFTAILDVMEQTPPELYSDICNEGIILTGGGAKLYGIDKELSSRLGIKVTCAADSENCAAKGAGYILKNMKKLEDNGYSFRSRENMLMFAE